MKTLGIDIGGSKIRAVLLDGKRVLRTRQMKTPHDLASFKKILSDDLLMFGKVGGAGIGIAGVVSGTKIIVSPNIGYLRNIDFKKFLGVSKIKIDNDARCFSRAVCGKYGICLAITLGTGIGRGLAKNGEVLKIKKFEYPELWEKEYQKMRGEPKALMSAEFADFLAKNLSSIIKKYKVSSIVFGGGVTDRNGFAVKIRSALRGYGMMPNITISGLGKNAVAMGAALMLKTP